MSMWHPDPPQGFSTSQEQVIIGRPMIPLYGAPQGVGVAPEVEFAMAYEPDNWADAAYKQRIPLTINGGQVPSTINDFVLLINSTFPDLIGKVKGEIQIGTNDIPLDQDIQSFDDSTGALIAWAKVPSISDGDDFFVYFDNPTVPDNQNPFEVWSDYAFVYHMNNVVAPNSILDSTISQEPGDPVLTTLVDAKIGQGQDFDENAAPNPSRILFPNYSVPFSFTTSMWIKTPLVSNRGFLLSVGTGGGIGVSCEIQTDGTIRFTYRNPPSGGGGVILASTLTVNDNNFHRVVCLYDDALNISKINIDGVADVSATNALPPQAAADSDGVMGVLLPASNSFPYDGIVDEFQTFRGVLSDDRLLAEFNNQNAPNTFYSTGTIESVPAPVNTMAYEVSWLDTDFLQRIPLTIQAGQVSSTQTDFPLLINNIFPDLIGEVEAELRFAGTDNVQLEYEIEKFDNVTGELIAWILKPTVSDGDIINIYFDNAGAADEQNPAAVWSDYEAVWHLNQIIDAVDSIKDSSPNANHLTPVNTPTLGATGKIGNAVLFDAAQSESLTRTLPNLPVGDNSYTLSAWIADTGGDSGIIGWGNYGTNLEVNAFRTRNVTNLVNFWFGNDIDRAVSLTSAFHKVEAVYNVATGFRDLFFDGAPMGIDFPGVPLAVPDTSNFAVGLTFFTQFFDGIIDEVRVSGIARSNGYIETQFNNENNQNAFYSIGTVEGVPPATIGMEYEE